MGFKWRCVIGTGLAVAGAAASALVFYLATASAQSAPATATFTGSPAVVLPALVTPNPGQPVAGKLFAGLIFRKNVSGGTISWVECDAKIGGKRLHARQQSFYAGPHQRDKVICRWRIPANAAGKELHLWSYKAYGGDVSFVVNVWSYGGYEAPDGAYWIVKR
ncbi:MAG TPA: hypothetical protein VE985_02550 [Gaiellaceae bacterium]|jgi:hypothetical protein|nr:hypothetical protein [Gaiellaceae bacterium]